MRIDDIREGLVSASQHELGNYSCYVAIAHFLGSKPRLLRRHALAELCSRLQRNWESQSRGEGPQLEVPDAIQVPSPLSPISLRLSQSQQPFTGLYVRRAIRSPCLMLSSPPSTRSRMACPCVTPSSSHSPARLKNCRSPPRAHPPPRLARYPLRQPTSDPRSSTSSG